MKRQFGILFVIVLIACQHRKPKMESLTPEVLSTQQIDSILTEFKFQYESPIVLDGTNHVLIPISTQEHERSSKLSLDVTDTKDYPRYWNVLFYDRNTRESQLLSNKKLRISRIHITEDGSNEMNNIILFEICDLDFNNDKKLNDNDPTYLFASEISGNNLKRVSPKNEYLQYFEVVPKSVQILIKTLRDINRDSVFNQEDESIWYHAELVNEDWILNEIVDSAGRKEIENLYFEQWIK